MAPETFPETPTQYLDRLHRTLRDNAIQEMKERVVAVIVAFFMTGMIDKETYRLRLFSLNTCPGHSDEGGRDWCTYCGAMPQEEQLLSHTKQR